MYVFINNSKDANNIFLRNGSLYMKSSDWPNYGVAGLSQVTIDTDTIRSFPQILDLFII